MLADFVAEVGWGLRRTVIPNLWDGFLERRTMMGRLNHDQGQLFYSFCLADAVPDDHPIREIAAVLDLRWVYAFDSRITFYKIESRK